MEQHCPDIDGCSCWFGAALASVHLRYMHMLLCATLPTVVCVIEDGFCFILTNIIFFFCLSYYMI